MDREWVDDKPPPGSSHSRVIYSRNEGARSMVVGSSKLYEDGTLRLVPMPTPDPKDPLNLPIWRKWLAIAVVCFFGGLAFAAERGISALLPVFVLEYANENTHLINGADFAGASAGNPAAVSPLAALPFGAAGTAAAAARLDRVELITTVVLVADSLASLILVPLSAAVGRRPVMLLAVAVAVAGWLWAALSRSLTQHLIARGMQGFGGGALEALVPLIVTDVLFVHQRNAAMAAVMASQGVMFAAIGFAAPYIAAHYDWRVVYFVITGLGFLALVLVAGLLPETRWSRSDEELSGQRLWPIREGDDRPEPDFNRHSAPRLSTYVGLFQNGVDFREIPAAYFATLRAFATPAVLWGILANTIFLVAVDAASHLSTDALLARGWSFQDVGLATGLPFFGASLLVMAVNGPVADEMANAITQWNAGRREPEQHLASAVVPFLAGVAGCFVVGVAAQQGLHWSVLLVGAFLVVYGGMAVATVVNVLVAESYPAWAGAALANVSSLRIVAAFFFSGGMKGFPSSRGLLATYAVFAEIMIVVSLGIPVLYFFGRRFRSWTAGRVYAVRLEKRIVDDGASI